MWVNMVENTQSWPLFLPVTQITKLQEGILSSRLDYVEDRKQFSNTKEKYSNKNDTLFKNARVESRLLKHHNIPICGKNKMYSTQKKHRNKY